MRTKTPEYEKRVLDAAGRLFGTQRFHLVRMEDVALLAEVSKGTLYRYFHDKEEMYRALLERASHGMVTELKRRTAAASTARGRLIAVIEAVLDYFDAQPHLFDLILRAEAHHEEGGVFPWQEVRDRGVEMVTVIFAEGKRAGEFQIRCPDVAALMLLGGLRAVVRFGEKPRPRKLAERMVEIFLEGAIRA